MRILIADDHSVLREGVKNIVQTINESVRIDEATDGNKAIELIKANSYDLVILDITMPGMGALEILQVMQNSGIRHRTIILSFHPEEHYASRAFKLGAKGYVSKSSRFDEIKKAIVQVAGGGRYVSPTLAEKLAFREDAETLPHEKLSDREFQVMQLLARGKSITEIAKTTFITDKTVSTYRARILKKMNMKTNAELTIYALKNKLIV